MWGIESIYERELLRAEDQDPGHGAKPVGPGNRPDPRSAGKRQRHEFPGLFSASLPARKSPLEPRTDLLFQEHARARRFPSDVPFSSRCSDIAGRNTVT